MVSNSPGPSFGSQVKHEGGSSNTRQTLWNKINLLKKQIQKERVESIKEKIQRNGKNLQCQLSEVMLVISSRNTSLQSEESTLNIFSSRMDHPQRKFNSCIPRVSTEGDQINNPDAPLVKSIKMTLIERLPRFTFWTNLTRNELMTEDQSVFRTRYINYDHHGGETLITNISDTEEEPKEYKEVQRDFSEGEDQFLRMVFEKHGLTEEVLSIVSDVIGGTSSEIQERYEHIKEKEQNSEDYEESGSHTEKRLQKSLSVTLDGFNHLLCRQCMIFDCSVHGRSQKFIYPNEKQNVWSEPEDDRKPCSDYCHLNDKDATISDSMRDLNLDTACNEEQHVMDETELNQGSNSMEGQIEEDSSVSNWKPLEKELYLKGIEMFGRNSCLISRNLLAGLKTCKEVSKYMSAEASRPHGYMGENGRFDAMSTDNKTPSRPRKVPRKNKAKRFSSKSAGLPSTWKQVTECKGKHSCEKYKQYTPCECKGTCGKECSCLVGGYFCEKYCGCSMLCRNRFGGCHCNKTHCRSRHCPCFAALRECDPDVCKNCWVSCGDGSLGESSHRAEGQCENMNMLLGKKKHKILWGRSDITGWGAFLKNHANKNDFLGEYTGELVSHIEAEKRGNFYDCTSFSSFLFNLNNTNCIIRS
ncbi:histone-lysine N-methyltransferase EZA1-like [Trifolium pratense]|uniref:histone-lysine N-methyltransferase EZA1-like n=1 Tax=Trifolium pratense TaxID=57577 RepID=UPI001E691752|nr:histone-lysine N-methyltransferase EZA1-like [Trifolium pratense]